MNRRDFLGAVSAAGASTLIRTGGGASLLGLAGAKMALAKPGGHNAMAAYCVSAMDIQKLGVVQISLGGTGFASINNVVRQGDALNRSILAMDWEAHNMAAELPQFGLVCCTGKVKGKSHTPSTILIQSKAHEQALAGARLVEVASRNERASPVNGNLFPAVMTNRLFFEMEFPGLGLRLINKEPMILVGETNNLDEDAIARDPRVMRYPAGRPKSLRAGGLNPYGVHKLAAPVPYVDVNDPDKVVGTLVSSEVTVAPHYGLDVTLTDKKMEGAFVTTVWQISNLLPKPQRIMWFADDTYNFQVVSKRRSEPLVIEDKPVTVTMQAINKDTSKVLDRRSCLFLGCNSLAGSMAEFSSAFGYIDGEMLLNPNLTGPIW